MQDYVCDQILLEAKEFERQSSVPILYASYELLLEHGLLPQLVEQLELGVR